MQARTPEPDPAVKSAHVALAEKNFAARQGSGAGARPTSDSPARGVFSGVRKMFATMTTRGGLAATSAIVAVGLVVLTPLGDALLSPRDVTSVLPKPTVQKSGGDAAETASAPILPALAPPMLDAAEAPIAPLAEIATGGQVRSRLSANARMAPGASPAPSPVPADSLSAGRQDDTETYANDDPNPVRIVRDDPVSTFSIDVDTASYALVRDMLDSGQLPPPDAVRIEEMINYFPYDYPAPQAGEAFRPTVSVSPTPWNSGTKLVHIGIQGALPEIAERPPLNLVFLIDTSGSMKQSDKLPLLKQSFALMLGQLRAEDQVAIVTYAGSAGQVLPPTPASDRAAILAALDRLEAGGSTAGEAGLQQAYTIAETMQDDGEVSRIILATDGDFNVGISDPDELETYIARKRDSGTYLSILGFGRGNLDDATMQALAQNGNGTAAYIDTLNEAQKVLVDQLTGALYPIADDVKIQVEFNPAQIAEYRLIGYETRALRREDFNNDRVDAGDIGAGHQVTALYEITPVDSPARLNDELRYGAETNAISTLDELGFLRLRYKAPGARDSALIEMPITSDAGAAPDAGFAIAIAGFGQLLRGSTYLGDWSWGDAIALANANRGEDSFGYRAEAVQLMRLAQSLSAR
jgi:Ca-activated chloride channel family protein